MQLNLWPQACLSSLWSGSFRAWSVESASATTVILNSVITSLHKTLTSCLLNVFCISACILLYIVFTKINQVWLFYVNVLLYNRWLHFHIFLLLQYLQYIFNQERNWYNDKIITYINNLMYKWHKYCITQFLLTSQNGHLFKVCVCDLQTLLYSPKL